MGRLLRSDDWRFGIERFQPPGIRHGAKRRPAFRWRRGGNSVRVKRRQLRLLFMLRVVSILRTGALGLAQGLHEQAHSSPSGRGGIK